MCLVLRKLGLAISLLLLLPVSVVASPAPTVEVARLDCGTIRVNAGTLFSDTFSYQGRTLSLVESCYLIRHGDDYMLWDSGLSASRLGVGLEGKGPIVNTLDQTLRQQFEKNGFNPNDIDYVGISHYHNDHTGQVKDFPEATLLIGSKDWSALTSPKPPRTSNADDFKHWISGEGEVIPVARDLDVFGDGTVVILATPGHTPGHKSLLIRLAEEGNILFTGDLAHFKENYTHLRVPLFNTNRADSLASFDRFKSIAETLDAKVVIQHDPDDVSKISPFPDWTR